MRAEERPKPNSLEKHAVRTERKALLPLKEFHVVKVGPDVGRAATELERFAAIRGIP